MDANQLVLLSPLLQYGFAGLSLVLIGVLAWLMNAVLKALSKSSDVIAANTQAIHTVEASVKDTEAAVNSVRDQLLRFSCPYNKPADHRCADRSVSTDNPSEAPHALAGT